jgi:hypothetical protein
MCRASSRHAVQRGVRAVARCCVFALSIAPLSLLAGEIASAAAAASPAFNGLPLKADDASTGYPIAGLVFLALLLGVAVWARWHSRLVRTGRTSRWQGLLSRRSTHASEDDSKTIVIESTTTLDATTKLYAVAWRGRHLLVAKTAGHGVAVLEREPTEKAHNQEARPC